MTEASPERYIHGTEPNEQQRLVVLNRLTNPAFVEFLAIEAGMRVLEVGSGLGILAGDAGTAKHDVRVVGLEKSAEQIAAARPSPNVHYIQGDARYLPLPTDGFDLVYARFLLEHVFDPNAVLKEMKRVVRRGGRVAVCENDISVLRFDPPCAITEEVWDCFERYQRTLGGDGLIGRRLYRLFHEVGLSEIELSVQTEVHWHGSSGFDAWVQNIVGNIESARRGLIDSGFAQEARINEAVNELRRLRTQKNASSWFVWNRAVGRKL